MNECNSKEKPQRIFMKKIFHSQRVLFLIMGKCAGNSK
jgi:hypothetical protein